MKKFKTFFTAVLVVLLSALMANAQSVTVRGTVRDASTGEPVSFAAFQIKGTFDGGSADVDGNYSVSVAGDAVLIFSFMGYETLEVSVNGRSQVDVQLRPDSEMLEQVVVTGYGVQRKAAFTGASTVVGEEVLAVKNDANFVKALQGTVPGVQINSSTSMPGVWSSIYIRGRGSLSSGSQPLYVIDGMPVNSDTDGNGITSSYNSSIDPMAGINPSDIQSITVLKDASATAIYGSRAANGVIVVTTKKGSEGSLDINVDIKNGFTTMANNNMNFANAFQTMDLFTRGWMAYQDYLGSSITYDDAYAYLTNYFRWDGVSSYDWVDAITRKGYYQDYNIGIQGRTGNTGYYISLGYMDTEGIVLGTDFERFSGRINLDSKFKWATLGVNASYSYSTQNGFSQSTGGSMRSPVVAAISSMNPMYPFYDENGDYANVSSYNALALTDETAGEIFRTNYQVINLNPYFQIDFGKGIYAKTTLGVNLVDETQYDYWSAVYNPQGMDYNGYGQWFNSKNSVITWNNILGWNYEFNYKHEVAVMLGQEMQMKDYTYAYFAKSDFPYASSGMRDLTTAGTDQGSEYYKAEARLASYFIDGHYSYDSRYYISASFRRDGSSVFGANNRWGNFWSVGAKWRVSQENFLRASKVITDAAIRASYGTVGNQDIGWYSARGFYSSGYNYNQSPGMSPTSIANENLTWEVSNKFDAGFDLSLWRRLNVTFDFYNDLTTDALYSVPLSMTTGLASTYQNIGSIRNRGVEFSVDATLIREKDFSWNMFANATWNKNIVVKLATDDAIEGTYTILEEGRPYTQFYMKEFAGVDPETGRPLWYLNETGDETTTSYNDAAKRYVGDADPKLLGGFGTNLTWKGIDFSLNFTYRIGGKVLNYGASYTGFGMSFRTPLVDVVENSWTEDNPNAKYPQYIYSDPYNATSRSTRFLYDASYLRISNVTLGYTLPTAWTSKCFIKRLRAYVQVDNLYTITASDFVGYTPDTYTSGLIAWQYPATTTFVGGLQLTF